MRVRARVGAALAALALAIIPTVSAHAADRPTPRPTVTTTIKVVHPRHAKLASSTVGWVHLTYYRTYVHVAWQVGPLGFSHFDVDIMARQSAQERVFRVTRHNTVDIAYTHFPPRTGAGYAIYVYGVNAWGYNSSLSLGQVPYAHGPGSVLIDHNGTWADLIPGFVKKCNKYAYGAMAGTVATGMTINAVAAIVPPVEPVTVAGTMAAAAGAGVGAYVTCFVVNR